MANERLNGLPLAPPLTNTFCWAVEDPNTNSNTTYKLPPTAIVDTTLAVTNAKLGVVTSNILDGITLTASSNIAHVNVNSIVDGTTLAQTSNVAHVVTSGIVDGSTLGVTSNVAHVNTSNIVDGTTLGVTGSLAHVNTSNILDGTTLAATGSLAHVVTSAIVDGSTLGVTSNVASVVASALVDNRNTKATSNKIVGRFSGCSINHTGSSTYSLNASTAATLPFDNTLYDTDGYANNVSQAIVIPWTGYYEIGVNFVVNYTSNTDTSQPHITLRVNGTDIYTLWEAFNYNTSAQTTVSKQIVSNVKRNYTAGDVITVYANNTSNTTWFIKLNVADLSFNPAFFQASYLGT